MSVLLTLLVLMPLCSAAAFGGWFGASAIYRDGYSHGYSDGVFNAEFPEFADGPMFGGDAS